MAEGKLFINGIQHFDGEPLYVNNDTVADKFIVDDKGTPIIVWRNHFPPGPPTNFVASDDRTDGIVLTWVNPDNVGLPVCTYDVYRDDVLLFTDVVSGVVDTTAGENSTYIYFSRATNEAGYADSNTDSGHRGFYTVPTWSGSSIKPDHYCETMDKTLYLSRAVGLEGSGVSHRINMPNVGTGIYLAGTAEGIGVGESRVTYPNSDYVRYYSINPQSIEWGAKVAPTVGVVSYDRANKAFSGNTSTTHETIEIGLQTSGGQVRSYSFIPCAPAAYGAYITFA